MTQQRKDDSEFSRELEITYNAMVAAGTHHSTFDVSHLAFSPNDNQTGFELVLYGAYGTKVCAKLSITEVSFLLAQIQATFPLRTK